MPPQLSNLNEWYNATFASSVIWNAIGVAAAMLVALIALYFVFRGVIAIIGVIGATLASRKRRSTQGFGIAVAPIMGPKGGQQTKAIIAALDKNLEHFTFGSPFEIVRAPRMRAHGAKGLRAAATKWLTQSSTDLVLWGHRERGKNEPARVEVLSLGGSLPPSEAMHTEGILPFVTKDNQDATAPGVAYLIARALQPGLADGTACKAEKLSPVADV